MRLDAYLVEQLPELSRRRAREMCEREFVRVNGSIARAGYQLQSGDKVEVARLIGAARARPELVSSSDLGKYFSLLYEDDDLLVVSKVRGLSSVTLREDDPITLADVISSYRPQCIEASPDPREAGLIQRLDYYTSGIVVAAKSLPSWEKLRAELDAGRIEKYYRAVVEGEFPKEEQCIDIALSQSRDGKTMVLAEGVEAGGAFVAETKATCLEVIDSKEIGSFLSVVTAKANRARRHQIRAHLGAIGHPLVGDPLYGGREKFASREGFLLHCEFLSLRHPSSAETVEILDTPKWELE